ncbi:transmembrane protein 119-like [Triplophysa dalaica]|uniref:transmembrane protein 119-like n=1 Tax=Triplophysa dalaica TaxID=1582913 RepID=UPI0024DF8355|nr:transmembrane protein 119-like [Triplophysa dalaica]XP_056602285.1 transmembrane protein 119-like [Triplophysa dalaica]
MSLSNSLRYLCVLTIALWCSTCFSEAIPFNASMEGSGDEPELIFPIPRTTHIPPSPSPAPNITATFIRIKDFIFNDLVDFLKENMLLIIVVTCLLVVIIFIVCCASAMSHKRKLEAYYPPKTYTPRKYINQPNKAMEKPQQTKPHHQDGQTTSGKPLREPTKALVGEKEGKDPRPKPKEVQQVVDVEEVEMQKDEPKNPPPSTSNGTSSQPLVCTCHLRNANPSIA